MWQDRIYASLIWPAAAIIVVTMDESAEVIQQALASGADDFIRVSKCYRAGR